MNCGKGEQERTIRKSLTNPGYTGFLQKFRVISKFKKMHVLVKEPCAHTPKNAQRRQAEPRQKNQVCIELDAETI